jgi:hypothetical protein
MKIFQLKILLNIIIVILETIIADNVCVELKLKVAKVAKIGFIKIIPKQI